jgi:hypothetical protein
MKIDFTFDTKYGVFNDAISLPDDHTFTEGEIEAIKQERVDNWIAVITAPPSEEVLVEELLIIETPIEDIVE